MNVDPRDETELLPVQLFLATINTFTLSMAPLCDCNCMFDHVTGHLTERTCDRLVSGTALKQPHQV